MQTPWAISLSVKHAPRHGTCEKPLTSIWMTRIIGRKHTNAKHAKRASIHEQKPRTICIDRIIGGHIAASLVTRDSRASTTCVRYVGFVINLNQVVTDGYSTYKATSIAATTLHVRFVNAALQPPLVQPIIWRLALALRRARSIVILS